MTVTRTDEPAAVVGPTGTRVDPAHAVNNGAAEPTSAAIVDQAANVETPDLEAELPPVDFTRLRSQAQQIAEYLRKRHQHLDRRESQLHAQLAEFEKQDRMVRLGFEERRVELDAREEAILAKEKDISERFERLMSAEQTHGASRSASDTDLTKREHSLAKIKAELEAARELLESRQRECDAERAELMQLRRQLEAEKNALSIDSNSCERNAISETEREQMARERQELSEERQRLAVQIGKDRRRMSELESRLQNELHEQREALSRRAEQLDRRQAAMEQTQEDLARQHREALELRLAAEELWSQLGASPAIITQAVAHTRGRLAEQFRLATAETERRQLELAALAETLTAQHEKLERHRRDLESMTVEQRREIESQAQALVTREQELDRQEQEFRRAETAWRAERTEMQAEIRRLMSKAFESSAH